MLIRKVFPQTDMFKFTTPDKAAYLKLIEGVSDISRDTYKHKVNKMLEIIDQI